VETKNSRHQANKNTAMGCVVSTEAATRKGADEQASHKTMRVVVAAAPAKGENAVPGTQMQPLLPPPPPPPLVIGERIATKCSPDRNIVFLFGGARSHKGSVADHLQHTFGFVLVQLEDLLLQSEQRQRKDPTITMRNLNSLLMQREDLSWVCTRER
jgi:hypothetical protein